MKQSPQILVDVFERISDAFVALDNNWCYTYMNKKAGEIFQRSPAQMIGKHIWTEFPEGIDQSFYKAYHLAMKEQQYIHVEEYYAPYDLWFENHIYPSPDGLSIFFRDITQRKNAEQLNEKIQKENVALINSTSDLLWSVSNDFTLIAANRAFVKGLKDNGGFIIRPGDNLLSPEHFQEDYLQYWKSLYQKGLSGETLFTEIYTPQAQSSDLLWFELKIDPIIIEEKISGIACSMRNITERKKAEQVLKESEEKFRALVTASSDIVYRMSPDWTIMNQLDGRGFIADTLKPNSNWFQEYIHPNDQAHVMSVIKEAIRTRSIFELEHPVLQVDGTLGWTFSRAVPLFDAKGEIVEWFGAASDITERKKAEEDIREAHQRLTQHLNNTPLAVIEWDKNFIIRKWSSQAENIFGWSEAEVMNKHFDEINFVFAEDARDVGVISMELMTGAVDRNKIINRNNTKSGKVIYCQWFNSVLKDAQGNVASILSLVQDITESKKMDLILAGEKKVMEMIATEKSLEEILNTIALNYESYSDHAICSIQLLNDEGTHIRHVAGPSLPDAYNKGIDGEPIGPVAGSCGTAAYRKERVIVSDIATNPLWVNYRDFALSFGLKAAWSTPIINTEGKVYGTFAIYYKECRTPEETELALIDRSANQVKIVLERYYKDTQIKESEEKYRTLVEQASDAIFIADGNGRFITVNTSACKLSQHSEKELLQMSIHDFAVMEDIQKNPFHFDELKQGKTVITERVMKRKDSSVLNVEITAKLLSDGRLLTFVRDITKRKKTEEELKKFNERFEMIARTTNDGLWEWNLETGELWANQTHQHLYGLTTADSVPAEGQWEQKIHPDDRKKIIAAQQQALASDKNVWISEYRFETKNGFIDIYDRCYIVRNIAGKPIRLTGSVTDISERKKAEEALAENENYLRTILESEPECVKVLNRKGELLSMNPAGLAMIEADNEQQVLGHRMTELVDEKYRMGFKRLSKEVFNGRPGTFEFEVTGLKGGHRWLETHAVPLKDSAGKITNLLGVTRDITDRKKAEDELIYTTDQLRQLTTHLQTIREEERKRIGREIHDELGQQLTAIKMDAVWIDKKMTDKNNLIKSKLKNIITLLDGSNQSVRKILSELRPGNLENQALTETMEWQGRQFTESTGIPVKFTSTETSLRLSEETATCIFRVYQESLTNIIRYAEATKVSALLSPQGDNIILTVEDDGVGFDTSQLKDKKTFGLLGMRERVFSLNGKLELISAKGKGTKIVVSLPYKNI